jgi:hypothetical protein
MKSKAMTILHVLIDKQVLIHYNGDYLPLKPTKEVYNQFASAWGKTIDGRENYMKIQFNGRVVPEPKWHLRETPVKYLIVQ